MQAYIQEFEDCFERSGFNADKFRTCKCFMFYFFADDLDEAKEALSKLKYFVTNSEMLHPLLPDE